MVNNVTPDRRQTKTLPYRPRFCTCRIRVENAGNTHCIFVVKMQRSSFALSVFPFPCPLFMLMLYVQVYNFSVMLERLSVFLG